MDAWDLRYGQGILHVSELALNSGPTKSVDVIKPCPAPAHLISRCTEKNLPVCPPTEAACWESVPRKMPYSQFRAADSDGSPPTLQIKCPVKYTPELLPDGRQDKSFKLSCKTYGEYKTVECPKQMFNRFMSVDLNSKNLVPLPITLPGYKPQREVKKGVCGRQTLLRPPSSRNFSTGHALMSNDYPEFIRKMDPSHLQPAKSPICFDKLAGRAGMDTEQLGKPAAARNSPVRYYGNFNEKDLEKHEIAARKDEETPEEKQKRVESTKTKLQLLIEKQEKESGKKKGTSGRGVTKSTASEELSSSPLFSRMVDLEETPYQRSRFHSSATQLARKHSQDKGSKGSKTPKMPPDDGKICSGCPGLEGEKHVRIGQSRCSTRRGGAKGKCRVQRAPRPEDNVSPLAFKCKSDDSSPCMRPRFDAPFLIGMSNRFIHLTHLPTVPLKERYIIENKQLKICSSFTSRYSQKSQDLLDQCCEELDKLRKQLETLKKEEGDASKKGVDGVKDVLNQCYEELEQLKKQLQSLKKGREEGKGGSDYKNLLNQCFDHQEEIKKQIETLSKSKVTEKKKGPNDSDKEKVNKDKKDDCKKDDDLNCKKIKEKKEKAEQCVQYLMKQNEKLKKEIDEMKKKNSQDQEKKVKSDDCDELKKETKKLDERKDSLCKENNALKKELESMKKLKSTDDGKSKGKGKGKKKDSSDSAKKPSDKGKTGGKNCPTSAKSGCQKKKPGKKNEDVPDDVKQAMAECVKQCAKKAKKNHLKKELEKEKKKCKQQLKQKQKAMQTGEEDDEGRLARFLHGICCKLQELAKKTHKKKK